MIPNQKVPVVKIPLIETAEGRGGGGWGWVPW